MLLSHMNFIRRAVTKRGEHYMHSINELSCQELLALKEIRLTSRATNDAIKYHLLKDGMIVEFQDGRLQLTPEGRRMLVRGSPSLWNLAS